MVISDRYPPNHEGGYGLKCGEAVDVLKGLGHDVTVLTTKFGVEKEIIADGIYRKLETLKWNEGIRSKRAVLNFQLKRALYHRKNYRVVRETIDKVRPDIVYVWQLYDVSVLPLKALRQRSIPMAFELSSYWLAEQGLGTCWMNAVSICQEPIKNALNLPPELILVDGVALGYPVDDSPLNNLPRERLPINDVTEWL